MELVVFFLLLKSLERLTTGGTVQLQERGLLVVGVDRVDGRLVLLLLQRSWLGSHAVRLVLMELQQALRGEGELTILDQAAMMVLEVDVSLKSIRLLEVLVTLSANAVLIVGTIFILNLRSSL